MLVSSLIVAAAASASQRSVCAVISSPRASEYQCGRTTKSTRVTIGNDDDDDDEAEDEETETNGTASVAAATGA